jgi:hypothetical protein
MRLIEPSPGVSRMPIKIVLRRVLEGDDVLADVVTLVLSYAFIFFGAWDDGLLGFAPNAGTWALEWTLALGLAAEIVLRLRYARERKWYFYPLIAIDAASVLTVIPGLIFVQFARAVRIAVSGGRMLQLIDGISRKRGNPYLILLVYPFVVPIFAAFFFYVEHHAKSAQVHNYAQAFASMLSYSLTVGLAASHPVTYTGKVLAGIMFLTGLMCVSIIGNALSERYSKPVVVSADPNAAP